MLDSLAENFYILLPMIFTFNSCDFSYIIITKNDLNSGKKLFEFKKKNELNPLF